MEQITIIKNKECNGLEIYPNGTLADEHVKVLTLDGWRWHKYKKCYYALATNKRYALVKKLFPTLPIEDDDVFGLYDKKINQLHSIISDLLTESRKLNNQEQEKAIERLYTMVDELKKKKENPPLPF